MRIAVCVKPVPDPKTAGDITIDPVTKRIRREQGKSIINPLDRNALELALRFKEQEGGEVAVFAMAPPSAINVLRETLALGADYAYLLSDPLFGGSDSLATANIIAAGLNFARQGGEWNLILFGAYSSDGGTSQVPAQVGEWLSVPNFHFVSYAEYCEGIYSFTCDYGDRLQTWKCSSPLLLSVTRDINKPRYTTIRGIVSAKKKKIMTLACRDLELDTDLLGLSGSPTKNGNIYPLTPTRSCSSISGSKEEIASKLLDILVNSGINILANK
ncbi:MAG: electron transfer flavoprotein subunit beta/FixA family protein [Synergistes jonesii]|uniref:electron transfer flavoprotein subunit beta/FixA family protein n=1 Tax=Synergistes jonesii TaxID=2754 RepID=UPI002A74A68F|nr:electron transfer flavoprotein subunit beta/FixA family protein [Synergistes jonesii]MDY2985585.1 electron transfer flavoprotein subunit beta/FixA family protein [Synergistes jonesii]